MWFLSEPTIRLRILQGARILQYCELHLLSEPTIRLRILQGQGVASIAKEMLFLSEPTIRLRILQGLQLLWGVLTGQTFRAYDPFEDSASICKRMMC